MRIRDKLAAKGYDGFGRTDASKEHEHRQGDRYITRAVLRQATEQIYGKSSETMLDGQAAVVESVNIISGTVQELALVPKYAPIAKQIIGALEQSRIKPDISSGARGLPLGSIITIANILGRQLNKKYGLTGEQKLNDLDTNTLLELPAAFQRILYAIDPELLEQAVSGPATNGNELRAKMVYLEALSAQWQDHRNRYSQSLGDAVMRLIASGLSLRETTQIVNRLRDSKSRVAVSSLRRIVNQHPNIKRGHAATRLHKPGYGAAS